MDPVKESGMMPATMEEVQYLCEALQRLNGPHVGDGKEHAIHLVTHRADGSLAGGILADVALGWVEIHVLWVQPDLRRSGLGATLLKTCEHRAQALGAHSARLDTFDWQAEDFYLRQGYVCFARLGDYPLGHERVFMHKRLQAVTT